MKKIYMNLLIYIIFIIIIITQTEFNKYHGGTKIK